MGHLRIRRYFITPFVYVAVILGLLYLQFSGTLTVRRTLGPLRFLATLEAGEDDTGDRITSARMDFEGLVVELSEDRPLVVRDTNGTERFLTPVRYEMSDERLVLHMDDHSSLRFEVLSDDTQELQIIPVGTDDWPQDGSVVLPWRFTQDVRVDLSTPPGPQIRDIRHGDRDFFLSTPARAVVDLSTGTIDLPLDLVTRMVRFAEHVVSDVDVIASAFGDNQRQISTQFYNEALDQFIQVGFQGWSSTRFNGGSGTWDMRDASPRFSERILTAYLAEAWRRNQYTTAFNQMRRAADQHPQDVGYLSVVFLGNVRQVWDQTLQADQQRSLTLSSRISARDPSVFHEEEIFSFAALRGNEELFRALLSFATDLDIREIDVPLAVSLASASVVDPHPTAASRDATRRFEDLVSDVILPAVRQFDERFFVESAQGEIDVLFSIRAGVLLERLGRRDNETLYTTVGRNLVLSGLQLADSRGFLPRLIFFNEMGIQRQEGSFGPEDLYPLISGNPWYPRKRSLYDDLGAGSFIWSIANFTRVDIGAEQSTFTLQYPRNRTHYVVIHGIPPFTSMNLFNLQWRNDPSFELYIKGRHFEQRTNTLMIKYTDDSVEGNIILFY